MNEKKVYHIHCTCSGVNIQRWKCDPIFLKCDVACEFSCNKCVCQLHTRVRYAASCEKSTLFKMTAVGLCLIWKLSDIELSHQYERRWITVHWSTFSSRYCLWLHNHSKHCIVTAKNRNRHSNTDLFRTKFDKKAEFGTRISSSWKFGTLYFLLIYL